LDLYPLVVFLRQIRAQMKVEVARTYLGQLVAQQKELDVPYGEKEDWRD
jgi:hypothetical protein